MNCTCKKINEFEFVMIGNFLNWLRSFDSPTFPKFAVELCSRRSRHCFFFKSPTEPSCCLASQPRAMNLDLQPELVEHVKDRVAMPKTKFAV